MEAEDRERITQAAFLISQGKIEEADALAGKVLVSKPSLEAEGVLRTLGVWHALQGRWAQAAERFNLLLQVDQRDNSWAITDDLLMAGPILIERGDTPGYEHFRQAAITRFQGMTDPIFAERTLKISLLLPANDSLMNTLQQFSGVASDSMQKPGDPNDIMAAWRCISLGLAAYRQGYTPRRWPGASAAWLIRIKTRHGWRRPISFRPWPVSNSRKGRRPGLSWPRGARRWRLNLPGACRKGMVRWAIGMTGFLPGFCSGRPRL